MDEARPVVRVTDDDRVAAGRILACIARPYDDAAAARAGKLLQQWFWARRRHRREGLPDDLAIRVPDKDKIAPKLEKLSSDIWDALQAGDWFKLQWAAKSAARNKVTVTGVSIGALAARRWNRDNKEEIAAGVEAAIKSTDDQSSPMRQKIWIRRRPVLPMALAVSEEVRERHGQLPDHLEALAFDPYWVAGALVRAERYAEAAIKYEILNPGEPRKFIR